MKKNNIILMADIIESSQANQNELMLHFKKITSEINQRQKQKLLSPLTITLGDEFQSITTDVDAAMQLIFAIEELIIASAAKFKLRYVVYEGLIETPINTKIAHEMLGEGLSNAREALQNSKKTSERFHISLKNSVLSKALTQSFTIYQNIVDSWNIKKDHELITNFIVEGDYKKVALALKKTRSQIWKREKTLRVEDYFSIKHVINYIVNRN